MNAWYHKVCGAVLLFAAVLQADVENPAAVFEQGNAQYAEGNYAEAVEVYRKLLPRHQSANLHFNLGNAYYQLGDFGPAILHFEKAATLAPRNPTIRANLELTMEAAQVAPRERSWTASIGERLTPDSWAWLAVISFWGSAGLIVLAPLFGWKGPLRSGLIALFISLFLLSALGLYGWHRQAAMGVVLTDEATLGIAPTTTSPAVGAVKAGDLGQIRERRGNYYLVSVETDKLGWLSSDEFQPVWDRH